MYKQKRGDEKTEVFSELALTRHFESGWELDEGKEATTPEAKEPAKRGPKPKNQGE